MAASRYRRLWFRLGSGLVRRIHNGSPGLCSTQFYFEFYFVYMSIQDCLIFGFRFDVRVGQTPVNISLGFALRFSFSSSLVRFRSSFGSSFGLFRFRYEFDSSFNSVLIQFCRFSYVDSWCSVGWVSADRNDSQRVIVRGLVQLGFASEANRRTMDVAIRTIFISESQTQPFEISRLHQFHSQFSWNSTKNC
ncbi:hypothetical protein HanPSC8_Chr17g0787181 [Helianthus annuus]|nr:hypothetical protein HanPSC8_Chr17g0787181 [Helianthus annuus]